MTYTNADLKRWLALNLVEIPTGEGTLTYVSPPRHVQNVSQLAHWLKYDLLIDEHPYLTGDDDG